MGIAEIIMMLTFTEGGYAFFSTQVGPASMGWEYPWKLAGLAEAICASSTS